jgi:NAD+ synthase
VVFGLSGGIDSGVVACLAKKALGDRTLGLILPCHSLKKDIEDAYRISRQLDLAVKEIDLGKIYDFLIKALPTDGPLARANIGPRLRMIVLYYFANLKDYLVAGTGNKSEIMVGYFTKYGDGGVDILPIGDLLKSEVRQMARYLGIPEDIITKPPSAGLWKGQTDEEEMGISYEELDTLLWNMDLGKGPTSSSDRMEKINSMIGKSAHKRDLIPVFRKP